MNEDITFCLEDCEDRECIRNKRNIMTQLIPHSFAQFKWTDYCDYYRDGCTTVAEEIK